MAEVVAEPAEPRVVLNAHDGARRQRFAPARVAGSVGFFLAVWGYIVAAVAIPQRLVLFPLLRLRPHLKTRMLGRWIQFHATAIVGLARRLGRVRIRVRGAVPQANCVVVMNHQSVFDIPIALSLVGDPYPLIIYRKRYEWGMPAVSPLLRRTGSPAITQGGATSAEIRAIAAAADRVAEGENSMLIYPEGHRTRTGEIGPFMRRGLTLVLSRARQPVYCIVADGLWRNRTVADTLFNFGGSRVEVRVLGPFHPPADGSLDPFINDLRERMVAELRRIREEVT